MGYSPWGPKESDTTEQQQQADRDTPAEMIRELFLVLVTISFMREKHNLFYFASYEVHCIHLLTLSPHMTAVKTGSSELTATLFCTLQRVSPHL